MREVPIGGGIRHWRRGLSNSLMRLPAIEGRLVALRAWVYQERIWKHGISTTGWGRAPTRAPSGRAGGRDVPEGGGDPPLRPRLMRSRERIGKTICHPRDVLQNVGSVQGAGQIERQLAGEERHVLLEERVREPKE